MRLPKALVRAIDRAARRDNLDRSAILRRIVAAGLDRYVAELYAAGRISLREAADWLGVPVRVAMDRLADAGALGNVTWEDARAALEALELPPRTPRAAKPRV
ncbi:MAG: ribbon-helix-helix protein, CopG family [Armatimonadota bacterium]|nr:ribbon-helix-helix protein, CopG family [Armatimonadota bacterium]